jgi:hypothetical protein
MRNSSRERAVSASRVVPMRTIRNMMRSGVMKRMFTRRAPAVTGVMSP